MPASAAKFLACLVGFTFSSSVLVLLIPSQFEGGGNVLLLVGFAFAAVVFGAGMLRWRPRRHE